ncbi:MAG: endonuclease III [Candidatus Harrisonbacteria bacterium RIFOXYD1_FULL_40_9]|uniref:Endonuclease III n=1 Tax=Candidatus Harrisonbacteria bacterium RIFOXYD1_FULL_40_9 TaxID=1798412 RepID=A0A1G1ZYJ8_9BACT|nr:MAG: endonuclease III [Candidatus Harrisonbacteria bacterium RIFOXYD1_FULL_40_9]
MAKSAMTDEQLKERKKRALQMIKILEKLFPEAHIALNFENNWQLLIAVILSAQCTDKKVNEVTQSLFQKYKTLDDYVNANVLEFEKDIKPTGFYHTKAKNILAAAKLVKEKWGGEVPRTMENIMMLPGVARKTANVVLGNAYGVRDGIAVDTHVRRLALKFDLTRHENPDKIEQDLLRIIPKKYWFPFTYMLIDYGRSVCVRKKHPCKDHPLSKIFPPAAERWF